MHIWIILKALSLLGIWGTGIKVVLQTLHESKKSKIKLINKETLNFESKKIEAGSVVPAATTSEKTKIEAPSSSDIYETINDHTFKLNNTCNAGTGWILDFVIPDDDTYPVKWFVATNLHVINDYYFQSNPYNQFLPRNGKSDQPLKINPKNIQHLMDCNVSKREKQTQLQIFKTTTDPENNLEKKVKWGGTFDLTKKIF